MIRGVIYRLKRGYGLPLAIYQQTSSVVDLTTGAKTVSTNIVRLDRAIVLPATIHKNFIYDIGFLKANSNFTYGGIFTEGTRQIIIDRSDLPAGFEIMPSDQYSIVYDHKRYSIKSVDEYEQKMAYLITMVEVKGAPVNEVYELQVHSRLKFTETVGGQDG